MAQPLIFNAVQSALQRRLARDQMDQQADENDQNRAVQVLGQAQQAAMEPMRQASMLERIKQQGAAAQMRQALENEGGVAREQARGDWKVRAQQSEDDAQRDIAAGKVDVDRYKVDMGYRQAVDVAGINLRGDMYGADRGVDRARTTAEGGLAREREESRHDAQMRNEHGEQFTPVGSVFGGVRDYRKDLTDAKVAADRARGEGAAAIAKINIPTWQDPEGKTRAERSAEIARNYNQTIAASKARALQAWARLNPNATEDDERAAIAAFDAQFPMLEYAQPARPSASGAGSSR